MGAVFTAAAAAPLTSVASVLEMTGDFSLALPVILAVAIATAVSRGLSYGTIYTTKLLRRGTDIDRSHSLHRPIRIGGQGAVGLPGRLSFIRVRSTWPYCRCRGPVVYGRWYFSQSAFTRTLISE
jgi:hypothetical protein